MPIVFAFSAGIVAAFNPCGAAMFPAYIGYQFNSGYGRIGHGGLFVRGVALGLSVTAGFIVVFGMMGGAKFNFSRYDPSNVDSKLFLNFLSVYKRATSYSSLTASNLW